MGIQIKSTACEGTASVAGRLWFPHPISKLPKHRSLPRKGGAISSMDFGARKGTERHGREFRGTLIYTRNCYGTAHNPVKGDAISSPDFGAQTASWEPSASYPHAPDGLLRYPRMASILGSCWIWHFGGELETTQAVRHKLPLL